jgi:hypothetical protein
MMGEGCGRAEAVVGGGVLGKCDLNLTVGMARFSAVVCVLRLVHVLLTGT